jgi:hypothetical protein
MVGCLKRGGDLYLNGVFMVFWVVWRVRPISKQLTYYNIIIWLGCEAETAWFQLFHKLFHVTIIPLQEYYMVKTKVRRKKMKSWKIITLATLAVVASALLLSTVVAMGPIGFNQNTGYGGMMGRGGGMMGGYGYGYGYSNPPYTSQPGASPSTQYYQPVYPSMFGGGMMSRLANGLGFGGMMRGFGYAAPYTYNGTPLNITAAQTIAKNYVASIGNPDLTAKQIEEYQANFYVQVSEKSTGNGAFELLINKYSGSIYPEMGPNMMWNTKYGMMRSGALSGLYGTPTATMTVTATQAKADAQQYLTTYLPGTTTGDATTFYGYYTLEIVNGTTPYGMLSVNGYSGQVWYHTWHGAFIQELQVS